MTQIELFAGIGGFGLAGHWAGIETVCQVEIDEYCRRVLAKNFPHAQRHDDIHTFDGRPWRGRVDIVSGGFPCQPYSHAGKRKGNDDDRALWPEMLRVIREVEPMWVVGENVAGLISMDGGRVFAGIVTDLENAGYTVEAFVVPACAVGAPHRRDRVWVVAHADFFGRERRKNDKREEPTGRSGPCCCDFATSDSAGRGLRRRTASGKPGQHTRSSETTSDAHGISLQERNTSALAGDQGFGSWGIDPAWDEHWLPVAARLCRMDDGIPPGLDRSNRLKALGNAIVPQVAYEIFRAIMKISDP